MITYKHVPLSQIQNKIETIGYKYVSGEHKGANSKITLKCKIHGDFKKTWYSIDKLHQGCPKCSKASQKKTKEQIIQEVEGLGYKYISGEYNRIGSKSHITVSCSKHGEFTRPYRSLIKLKRGCPKCALKKDKTPHEEMIKKIEKKGYKYISGEYVKYTSKIKMKCDKHGEFEKDIGACLGRDRWCVGCGLERKNSFVGIDFAEVQSKLKECGCEVDISEDKYTHQKDHINIKCIEKGHQYKNSPYNIFRAGKCTVCSYSTSKQELELLNWVQRFYPSARKYTFKELEIDESRREIDIYIPELRLGIEFCGLYWHSEEIWRESKESLANFKKKHHNKFIDCERKDIHLITVFSDEWEEREFALKSFLKAKLKKCSRRVYARKCNIKEITWPIAKDFLNKYHIQGKPACSKYSIGLFFNDELLAVVTSSTHHRQGFSDTFVLNRLVYKEDVYILGGASRLNKKLIQYAKEHGYEKLISWSDNRISKGAVYESLGYNKVQEGSCDYSYVDKNKRQSKQSNKKKNLLAKGASGTMKDNTEREMAISLDLWRIWDCGKRKWEIKIK